jgi:hypothetical protein
MRTKKAKSVTLGPDLKQSIPEKSNYLQKAEEVAAYVKMQAFLKLWHEAYKEYEVLDTDSTEEIERKTREYALWGAQFPLPEHVEAIEEAGHIAKIYVLKEALDEDVSYNDLSQEIISDIEVKIKRTQREITILQNSLQLLEETKQKLNEKKTDNNATIQSDTV